MSKSKIEALEKSLLEKEKFITELKDREIEYRLQIKSLNSNIKDQDNMQAKLVYLKKDKEELTEGIENIQKANDTQKEEIDNLKKLILDKDKELSGLKALNAERSPQDVQKDDESALKDKEKAFREEIEALKHALQIQHIEMNNKLLERNKTIEAKVKDIEKLKEDIEYRDKVIDEAECQLEKKDNEIEMLEKYKPSLNNHSTEQVFAGFAVTSEHFATLYRKDSRQYSVHRSPAYDYNCEEGSTSISITDIKGSNKF